MTSTYSLVAPDDWHLHVRDGAALGAVPPATVRQFRRAIIMPLSNRRVCGRRGGRRCASCRIEDRTQSIRKRNPCRTMSSVGASRGRATDDKARSPGATRACSYPSGKLPPPRWPQAHTMGMPGRGFNGLSGVCGAKSTIDADG